MVQPTPSRGDAVPMFQKVEPSSRVPKQSGRVGDVENSSREALGRLASSGIPNSEDLSQRLWKVATRTDASKLIDWLNDASVTGNKEEAVRRVEKALTEDKTSLDLSNLLLSELPPLNSFKKHLTTLNLNNNELTQLSLEIGDCKLLEELSLNGNKLTELPSTIGSCTRLDVINIDYNKSTKFPQEMGNCKNILLWITYLDEGGQRRTAFRNASDINWKKVTESGVRLAVFLGNIPYKAEPTSASEAKTELRPSRNSEISAFSTVIPDRESLSQRLWRITTTTARYLFHRSDLTIARSHDLTDWLNDANITGNKQEAIDRIKNVLTTGKTSLFLSNLNLSRFPPLNSLKGQLTFLDLSGNKLTELPQEIDSYKLLTTLYLSNNKLTKLPSTIGNCELLTTLFLDNNMLTELPSTIGNCKQLAHLHLSDNRLAKLPIEIGDCAQLRTLEIFHNELTELPSTIGNCTQLTKVYLHCNRLTKLPREIGDCKLLTTLYLHRNGLKELPPEIINCTRLTNLSLNDDKLIKLPSELESRMRLHSSDRTRLDVSYPWM